MFPFRSSSPNTLSRHLLTAALMATIMPLLVMVALGLWQYQQDYNRVETFTGEESLSAARVVGNVLDFLVDDTRSMLQRIAAGVEAGYVTPSVLRIEGRNQAQTEGLEVTDAEGIITMSTIGGKGRSIAELDYFQTVRDGASVAYSDVFFSNYLRQNVVMIAVPYERNGKFAGVVMARLNLKTLQKLLSDRLDDPRFRNTFVVDRKGTIISHYDFRLVEQGANLREDLPVQAALGGKSGWEKHVSSIDNTQRISGFVQMPGTGWAVVSMRKPGDSVLGIEERLRSQLALAFLAALAVGTGAWLWGRKLSRPLERLAATIRLGAQASRVDDTAPPLEQVRIATEVTEYETLAEVYNRMAIELNQRFDEVLQLQNQLQAQNLELAIRNDELALLTAQAQASSRLKDQFLANMSHELRTPLNSIIGFTELTLTDEHIEMDEENRTNHEIVLKSAKHLLTLINDILDLSKIEAGKTTLYVAPFEPAQLVQAVVGTIEPLARNQSIKLDCFIDQGLGLVESDETRIRQILLNLVSNAVKFTKEGGVKVTMRPSGDERWAVVVEDTGIGIAPEHQELVFEEFRQVDGSTTRQAGGTGLGLSIARKLARLLGGDLTLKSALGVGSTFTLILPRRAPVGEAAPSGPTVPLPPPAERKLILVIDDDPLASHLLTEQIKDTEYRAILATGKEAALRLARERQPSAIVLDAKLRRNDDWEILDALKSAPETAGIPVLLLSFEENRAIAYARGAADFIPKPIAKRRLLQGLDRLHRESLVAGGIVMVIGDDADEREKYQNQLSPVASGRVETSDWNSALQLLEQRSPHVLILDIKDPSIQNPAVLNALGAQVAARHIPVIVVAGNELTEDTIEKLSEVRRVIPPGEGATDMLAQELRFLLEGRVPESKEN